MADFHFLRPFWLLLLLLIPLLPLIQRRAASSENGWKRIIPPHLLGPLMGDASGQSRPHKRRLLPVTMLVLLLAVALAGPAWRQVATPVQQQNDSLVIVLDLSLSMLATDVMPDRLTVAKRKIRDILVSRQASLSALVVYSADAHLVAPLTDDRRTIEGMLDVLDPTLMPSAGNRADLAIAQAVTLLNNGARGPGRIVLITDDVSTRYQQAIRNQMNDSRYSLSALVVGTEEGGPIPLSGHGFIRQGNDIVLARANPSALERLAEATGGRSHPLTLDDQDIKALQLRSADGNSWQDTDQDLSVERWQDDGYWLLWLILPLFALSWRQGSLLVVMVIVLPALQPSPAMAMDWDDLWSRPDQRGEALIAEDPERAAERFDDPEWRGSALYRAGDYEGAARSFAQSEHAEARYNRANALARSGKLQEAIDEYNTVLAEAPDHEDALINRDIVKELLEQQQSQNQDGDGEQDSEGENEENQNNQSSSGSGEQPQPGENDNGGDEGSPQSAPQDGDNSQGQPDDSGEADQPSQPDQEPESDGESQRTNDEPSDGEEQPAPALSELDTAPLSQGQEQWLRRVPDDPGGLLRRKFLQQYQNRETQPDKGDTPW
ncbi:VWA domain-containing protein [Marinobacter mobilis]|uniref:VWA domain-containing protein n=1 Tax=Marinobacter mobilis TaxID=488533 RepID=UPI0035C6FB0C